MTRTPSAAELGLAEPAEMDPRTYRAWLASLRNPDQSWDAGFRTPAVIEATGLTNRQVDYWARRNILVPELVEAAGSGSQRLYSFEDVCRAGLIGRLLDRGLTLEAAAGASARIRSAGHQICEVAGVFMPTENGPLVFNSAVSSELDPFVVMREREVRQLAQATIMAIVLLPEAE